MHKGLGMDEEIRLDDDSIPLWVRRQECMNLLDLALSECKVRGNTFAHAKNRYYTEKSKESFHLLNAGYANTFIQTVIKGRPSVAEAMLDYDIANVEYENAMQAINVYKLKLRALEAEIEREWEQTRRMQ